MNNYFYRLIWFFVIKHSGKSASECLKCVKLLVSPTFLFCLALLIYFTSIVWYYFGISSVGRVPAILDRRVWFYDDMFSFNLVYYASLLPKPPISELFLFDWLNRKVFNCFNYLVDFSGAYCTRTFSIGIVCLC